MNERTFNLAKRRELRRFHQAVDTAIDQLVAEKFEQTRDLGEYRQFTSSCNFARGLLGVVDRAADCAAPLFTQRQGERPRWEVYLSGLRKLFRDLPESYLFSFVLPMFGLDDLQEKVVAYSGRWLEGLHAAHRVCAEAERYLENLEQGDRIQAEHSAQQSDDLPRLYATLKTWETPAELEGYYEGLAEFIDLSFDVLVIGPVDLYLMLGKDTFTLIFKALNVGRLSDMKEEDDEFEELASLQEFLHSSIENSSTIAVLREISRRGGKAFVQNLRDENARLLAQLPTPDLRRSFVHRYEAGAIFERDLDEDY